MTVNELVVGVNIALGTSSIGACLNFDRNADAAVTIDELLEAVRDTLNGCTSTPEPVFPTTYRATFTEVRTCRFSTEHGGANVRVWANGTGTQPYLANANPLPVGSVVVKEEFNGPACDDADLNGWRVMRKEAPGFDPVDGDWHWQWVNSDRTVRFDDKQTCIGCHVRPACLARDRMCTEPGGPPRGTLTTVLRDLPAGILSIAGTAATDVYAVGADPAEDAFGPYVLHYDGQRWNRLNTGATGDLWWVSVTPIDGAFYMVGTGGLILRYDPVTGTFARQMGPPDPATEARHSDPGDATLFGVWGSDARHIWAVGGNLADEDRGGGVWFYDGTTWVEDDEAAKLLPDGLPTMYKVWGRNENDVYIVGRHGIILHFDGIRWSREDSASIRPLFTVHGNATQVVATGGIAGGVILELDGAAFVDRALPGTPQMNGAFVPPDGRSVAAGVGGALALRSDTEWGLADTGLNTALDFHAVWVDPEGGIWAVGGDLGDPPRLGIVTYGGQRTISSEVVPLAACPPPTNPGISTTVSYSRDVVPLFTRAGCTSPTCHGGPFPSSGYSLRTYAGTFGPGVEAKTLTACDIAPGNPDASFLIEKLHPSPRLGSQMPRAGAPLSDAEIAVLRTWILEGAFDDSVPTPTPPAAATPTPGGVASPTPTTSSTASCETPGIICTVAGTGMSVFDGDGRPATQTSFYFPHDVTIDAAGRALIVDLNNLRVRRIDADGAVRTVMGTEEEGLPTNGALAIDTPLHHASSIAFDSHGQLFVAGNHAPVVFRVGLDNRVQIVAGTGEAGYSGDGGPAPQARITTPFAVLPTTDGGLYASDIDAHVIRFVDTGGTIRTVAGNGRRGYAGDGNPGPQAELNAPTRMRIGPDGALYFCDTDNHVIRRLDQAGVVSTVAGTGMPGYGGDSGPARQAQFNEPYDLRFAPNGDLYVADTQNSVIRRIDSSGVVTTAVGTGRSGFAGDGAAASGCRLNRPGALAFAPDGSLWIADTFNQRVRRVAGFLGQ